MSANAKRVYEAVIKSMRIHGGYSRVQAMKLINNHDCWCTHCLTFEDGGTIEIALVIKISQPKKDK
ncbi:MAG: hypothetical protein QM523_00595 [Candidatus Pacebacteria bacterium]|nr:hypothetical protein [Candidatus Paceibacterota bacterium]